MNKEKVVKATLWSSLGMYGGQGVVFIVGIILARLLDPDQFGLIAMVTVFSSWGQIFLNSGFSQAIIQKPDTSEEDLSTVFYFNVSMGVIMAAMLFFVSKPIASFYGQPELVKLTQFISLAFVFNAFSIIQRTLLLKKIDLKSETKVIVLSSLISGAIAIYLAYRGFGVWSLAAKIVIHSFIESSLFWLINNWRPIFVFRLGSLKKFSGFAFNMLGAQVFNVLTMNIDKLIIGKLFSPAQLGFFDRSRLLTRFVQTNLGRIFSKVMFPVLADIQDDNERLIQVYRRVMRVVGLLVIPVFFGLIIIAKPLIVFLITEKWLPSVTFFQILVASGFSYPLSAIMLHAIAAKGRADIFFQLDVVKTALFIVNILIGSIWGIIGIVTAITLTSYVGLFINIYMVSKIIDISIIKQIADLALPLIFSTLMLALLYMISSLTDFNVIAQLLIFPAMGGAFYLALNYFFNREMLLEIKGIVVTLKQ